ncbi:hypothetical protein MBLNU459_g1774t2 [Dothideomycetes sp. NU459]
MAPARLNLSFQRLTKVPRGHALPSQARLLTSTAAPKPAPSALRRYRRAILWSSLGLAVGWTSGAFVSHTISPPEFPLPGSREDAVLMHDLEGLLDGEFKVKVLRGKCTAAAANLRGDEGAWRELAAGSANASLVQETLAGARGLGAERVFWNEKEKELVAVVWFGGAMSGWPGVAHGGGIATVLCEKMALAARLAKGGMGSEQSQEVLTTSSEPKKMEFTYKKPTYANAFYVVRAFPRYGPEYGGVLGSNPEGEVEVDANIETLDGTFHPAASREPEEGFDQAVRGKRIEHTKASGLIITT